MNKSGSRMAQTAANTLKIPMARPDITEAEVEAVAEVIRSGVLSIGSRIEEFEASIAEYVGAEHGIGVSSGTAGLHLALIAAGVEEGDFVVTTPFSFVASANVILYQRAVPIFVDVEPRTGNIDVAQVATAVADLRAGVEEARRWLPPSLQEVTAPTGAELKALLPVHVFGQPADMESIWETASLHHLPIVEDACEALGSEQQGWPVGRRPEQHTDTNVEHAACFAFYPNKQITTGEGGLLVTDSAAWANLFRSLRNQGRDVFGPWLQHDRIGYNYRLNEMSAALGVVQMSRLEEILERRRRVASLYDARLAEVSGVNVPFRDPDTTSWSAFVYVVRLDEGISRQSVIEKLLERGVPSREYFSPLHLQPPYTKKFGYAGGEFPVTEALSRTTLALPFFGAMSETDVDLVCSELEAVASEVRSPPTDLQKDHL